MTADVERPAAISGARWPDVRLGDVCEVNPRPPVSALPHDEDAVTFVPMAAVDERSGAITESLRRPLGEVRRGYTSFIEGDVIFAKITPCMQNGKHAIARALVNGVGFGSSEFHVIRPSEAVIAEWIHFFVRQPAVLKAAQRAFTGSAGQQRVPPRFLANLVIPLPPIPEQRRIAAMLTEQMAVVEKARTAAEAQLEAARALPAAYLRSIFDSDEARAWPSARLSSVAATGSGSTPSRGDPALYEGSIPWVKTGELLDSDIWDTAEHVGAAALLRGSLKLFPPGTVLVAMYGQGATRGRTGLLRVPATTNQACFAARPAPSALIPEFLQAWFRYSYGRLRDLSESRGGNQPNLNGELLGALAVPLPALAAQQTVVASLAAAESAARQASERAGETADKIEHLPAALLRLAFYGAPDA